MTTWGDPPTTWGDPPTLWGGGGAVIEAGECEPEPVWWVDSEGTVHALDAIAGVCAGRPRGRFMPPTIRNEDGRADGAGTYLRRLAHAARTVVLPVAFYLGNRDDLHFALRDWCERMNVLDGEGRLRYLPPDGIMREVVCAYHSGLELDEALGLPRQGALPTDLTFVAADPYWQGDEEVAGGGWSMDAPEPFLPIPNPTTGSFIQLALSSIAGTFTVLYVGTIPTYPRWRITGPADGVISATNGTTGDAWELAAVELDAGDVLEVDHKAGTVMVGDTSLFTELSDESVFWTLVDPSTPVTVNVEGTTGDSNVELIFRPRWLTV